MKPRAVGVRGGGRLLWDPQRKGGFSGRSHSPPGSGALSGAPNASAPPALGGRCRQAKQGSCVWTEQFTLAAVAKSSGSSQTTQRLQRWVRRGSSVPDGNTCVNEPAGGVYLWVRAGHLRGPAAGQQSNMLCSEAGALGPFSSKHGSSAEDHRGHFGIL